MRAHHRASALSARNVFCSGHSGGTENNVKSKCFWLKPLLLLFNERVITCMKTVVGKCCVCVQQSSCGIRWATGLCSGFLSVSQSFSTLGFVTGTYGIWRCKRGGEGRWAQEKSEWSAWEKHRLFCSLSNHTEVIFLSVLGEVISALWPFKIPCSL